MNTWYVGSNVRHLVVRLVLKMIFKQRKCVPSVFSLWLNIAIANSKFCYNQDPQIGIKCMLSEGEEIDQKP